MAGPKKRPFNNPKVRKTTRTSDGAQQWTRRGQGAPGSRTSPSRMSISGVKDIPTAKRVGSMSSKAWMESNERDASSGVKIKRKKYSKRK